MHRLPVRLLLLPLTAALLLLGGCFLPGGTAPDGCDLEPNGGVLSARPADYGEITSCADGTPDTDLFRLPPVEADDGYFDLTCSVTGTEAPRSTLQLLILPDGGTELQPLLPRPYTCQDLYYNQSFPAGTPYLRVIHPDDAATALVVRILHLP